MSDNSNSNSDSNYEAINEFYDNVIKRYVPYSSQVINFQWNLYNSYAPSFVKNVVETTVVPRTAPIVNNALTNVLPIANDYSEKAYNFLLGTSNNIVDVVLPPVSNETKQAAQTLFALPSTITSRIKQRSEKIIEIDIKNSTREIVSQFFSNVEKSTESNEASVYLLLNDTLVIIQTVPLPTLLAQNIPGKKIDKDVQFRGACIQLYNDSRSLGTQLASLLLERYNIRQSQLTDILKSTVDNYSTYFQSFKPTTTAPTTAPTTTLAPSNTNTNNNNNNNDNNNIDNTPTTINENILHTPNQHQQDDIDQ